MIDITVSVAVNRHPGKKAFKVLDRPGGEDGQAVRERLSKVERSRFRG